MPTYSALFVGEGNTTITGSEVTRTYSPAFPPTGSLTIPFDNFTVSSDDNQPHVQFTLGNGNWLLGELQGTSTTVNCSFACNSFGDPVMSISGPTSICTGGSETYQLMDSPSGANVHWSVTPSNLFTASSGTGTSANLSPTGATGNFTLVYTVIVNGCDEVSTSLNGSIEESSIEGTYTNNSTYATLQHFNFINPGSVYATVNAPGGNSYNWQLVPGSDPISYTANGNSLSFSITTGVVRFKVTANSDCGFLEREFTFLSLGGFMASSYPNPSKGTLTINFMQESQASLGAVKGKSETTKEFIITLFDENQKVVYQMITSSDQHIIDTSQFENGLYYLRIQSGSESQIQRIIIDN